MTGARADFPGWFAPAALSANLAAALLAFGLVWIPEVQLHWIGISDVDVAEINLARSTPSAAVLEEVSSQFLGVDAIENDVAARSPQRLTELAQTVLAGERAIGGYLSAPIPFPVQPSSLEIGLPTQQLIVASMGITHILLQAHRATGDERYLDAALEEALAFSEIDRWRVLPRGLLWNDHALAARIAVLADLWSRIRSRPDLDQGTAERLLELADRSAARLAKVELFTFRTNHGVMQSLALLQFALAFPTLERAAEARAIGCARLVEQLPYYIHPDGITLEHSPGYHELGRRLLTIAIRLFELNFCAIPSDWRDKLARATEFSRLMTRPDRTLPVAGNTDYAPLPIHEAVDVSEAPGTDHAVFPSAGFAVSWHGLADWPDATRLAQTFVAWSSFPSRAHKLADDMAVVVWAGGRAWLTNTGYWPYGVEGHEQATGWRGSNAPHLAVETARSERTTALRLVGTGPRVRFLEVERKTEGGSVSLRRQIVELDGEIWLVLDSGDAQTETTIDRIWTTLPETMVERIDDSHHLLTGTDVQGVARISFLGDLAAPPRMRIGEREPFSGWIVRTARPTPAPSFEIRQRVPGITATILSVGEASSAAPEFDESPQDPENWRIVFADSASTRSIQRIGRRLVASSPPSGEVQVDLSPVEPEALAQREVVVAAFEATASKYSGQKELTHYRYKASWLMLALLVLQELTVALVRHWSLTGSHALRVAAATSWLAVGAFAHFYYFP